MEISVPEPSKPKPKRKEPEPSSLREEDGEERRRYWQTTMELGCDV